MKTHFDPRHEKRRLVVEQLFANIFNSQQETDVTTKKIIKKQKKIDELIASAAPAWPLDKINKIDLAVLRLAVFELLEGKEPIKVIIDEAVELAKEYGSESSGSFVNGVLGTIVEKRGKDNEE